MAGAPIGNQNARRSAEWRHALQFELETYAVNGIEKGQALRAIARKCIEQALDGDNDARQEIANRLDGKVAQGLDLTHEVSDTLADLMRSIDGKSRALPARPVE